MPHSPKCESVCEEPLCDWKCHRPSDCEKPKCALVCEKAPHCQPQPPPADCCSCDTAAAPAAKGLEGSEEEVLAAQNAWANSIKTISAVYLKKGDYVQAAADAAGEDLLAAGAVGAAFGRPPR